MEDEKEKKHRKNTVRKPQQRGLLPPWKTGQSGNVDGRPKGVRNRSTVAKHVLEMRVIPADETLKELKAKFPEMGDKFDVEYVGELQQAKKIVEGDTHALEKSRDSAYGKANQSISGPDGDEINLNVKNDPYEGWTKEEIEKELEKLGYGKK